MTISADAQRRKRFEITKDSTASYPLQNITYSGTRDLYGNQSLIFILKRKSGWAPPNTYSIALDSVELVSLKDTVTLYHPKADTTCVDAINFDMHEGYCDWIFTFSLVTGQKEFLKKNEIDTVLFFDGEKLKRIKFDGQGKEY